MTEEDEEFIRIEREAALRNAAAAPPAPVQEPVPCCGKYETCTQACTPRGRFLGKRDALAAPVQEPLPRILDICDIGQNSLQLVFKNRFDADAYKAAIKENI